MGAELACWAAMAITIIIIVQAKHSILTVSLEAIVARATFNLANISAREREREAIGDSSQSESERERHS